MSADQRSNDMPRRIDARRGFSVFYKGKTLLSVIDPLAQAERIADTAPKLNRTLYFCPSPLYGYGIERLLTTISPDSAVVAVETDEKLMNISRTAMGALLAGSDRLRLVMAGDGTMGNSGGRAAAELCAAVRETWGSRRFRRVAVLRLSGGWQLDTEGYETLAAALRRDIATDWGNAMTLVKLGRRYIWNAVRNLALLPRTSGLRDYDFGASPVLVLGAGPSLDDVLDGLAAAFGELSDPAPDKRPFRIICVDTCLPAMKARNIRPDLVAVLESQHWNLRDFVGAGDWKIPVAMDLSALPATAEVLGGQVCLFMTPWTSLRFFDRLEAAGLLPEKMPPLGSVGLTAAALGLRLSSGPVIVGGIDFSFTMDRFHARSTPTHLEGLRRHTRLKGLINIGAAVRPGVFAAVAKSGIPVRSDPALKTYRDLFEQEFAGETRMGDIAGPGLPLGIQTLSLGDALTLLRYGGGASGMGNAKKPSETLPAEPQNRAALQNAAEAFIRRELDTLNTLRNILTGAGAPEQLEALLDECDYLWAHFPDCAGAEGRRPTASDISFLKRVRVEIDPFLKLWSLALKEAQSSRNFHLPPFSLSVP